MEPIDLFEKAVRFLAIKPLQFEGFNLEQAAMTTDLGATSLISQVVGATVYKQQNQI